MKTFIKINTSGKRELLSFEDPEQEYPILSGAVGGMIEMVPCVYPDHYIYLNEEGKLIGLEVNDSATALAKGLSPFDMIVGDVVIAGPLDEDGNHYSVSNDVLGEMGLLEEEPLA